MTETVDELKGYRGLARQRLAQWKVRVWSDVRVVNNAGSVFEGVILPRSENADDLHVVIKQKTGYNVGLHVDRVTSIEEIGHKEAVYKIPEKVFPRTANLPSVTLLGTGGTIASRLDYRTGAVIPAFTPGELYGAVPELAQIANMTTKKIFGVFSENMAWPHYVALAEAIGTEIRAGTDGIVIGHGTDTMGHTAAILSFMVQDSPVPIVLVGSQRSSDRPSSDAALNLIHAVKTAGHSPIAEVQICMFGPTSDQYGLLHRGTRCRKMHSSYRSTFRTIGDIPLCRVSLESFELLTTDYMPRDSARQVKIDVAYDDRVTIVYYYPGMKPDLIHALVDAGLPGDRDCGHRTGARQPAGFSGPEARGRAGRPPCHDGADAVGFRPDVRLRHRPRFAGHRSRPFGQHAPGDGPDETRLGARPYARSCGSHAPDASDSEPRNHRPRAAQRLSRAAGWTAGNRRFCAHALEMKSTKGEPYILRGKRRNVDCVRLDVRPRVRLPGHNIFRAHPCGLLLACRFPPEQSLPILPALRGKMYGSPDSFGEFVEDFLEPLRICFIVLVIVLKSAGAVRKETRRWARVGLGSTQTHRAVQAAILRSVWRCELDCFAAGAQGTRYWPPEHSIGLVRRPVGALQDSPAS